MKARYPLLDLLCVLLFVGIGRSAHQHGLSLSGIASTAWPFATGLAIGWLGVRSTGHSGERLLSGLFIVVVTVAAGMILRVVSGQGTAAAFIAVAVAFLSLFLVGWRFVLRMLRRSR